MLGALRNQRSITEFEEPYGRGVYTLWFLSGDQETPGFTLLSFDVMIFYKRAER